MADVKWIKITTDIFDDEKILLIESLPESDAIIVIWFKLLCLAGKQNNSGVFQMSNGLPYSEEMFASVFRKPVNTIRLALKTFQMYGMIEIVNDVVTVPNWSKHQTLDQLEERKNYMKNYMKKYRENQKMLTSSECKVNSKVNSKVNVSNLEIDKEIDIDIEEEIYKENKKENNSEIQLSSGDSDYLKTYFLFLKKKYPGLKDEEIYATKEYQNQYNKIISHY